MTAALPARPAWSQTTELTEWGREFSTAFGEFQPRADPPIAVELVQVELIDWQGEPSTIEREAPLLRINGYRYQLDQAAALAEQINAAI